MNLGGQNGGQVNNSTLPWTTLIDYVKVTRDSAVLLEENFDSDARVEAGPPAEGAARLPYYWGAMSRRRRRAILLVCMLLAAATIAYRARRAKAGLK